MLPSVNKLPYEERLHKLKLTTLKLRRERGDMIETFKIVNNYTDIESSLFFQHSDNSITRGHSKKFIKQQCKLDSRKYFYSQRCVYPWNKLNHEAVNATSINCLKSEIDCDYGTNQRFNKPL